MYIYIYINVYLYIFISNPWIGWLVCACIPPLVADGTHEDVCGANVLCYGVVCGVYV